MVIKIFQTNLNWVGNLCLAKRIFSLQTKAILVLENLTHFWGVTFSNQTGFGVEKDAEQNVAAKAVKVVQCLDKR